MSTQFDDELLSAYLDNELTLEERARVEEFLHETPAARDRLDELRQLSEQLQALPRFSAPPELAAAVLAQAERESLLSAESDSLSVPVRPRLKWVLPFCATLTTAALVVLIVRSGDNPRQAVDSVQKVELATSDETTETYPTALLDADAAPDVGATPAIGGPAEAGNAKDSAPKFAAAEGLAGAPLVNSPEEVGISSSQARHLQIGDVVPYMAARSDDVSVIEMQVVDIQEALGALHIVLDRHRIPDQAAAESGNAQAKSTPAAIAPSGLVALYVEASSEQLTAALSEIEESDLYVNVRLREPIHIAGLDTDETPARLREELAHLDSLQKKSFGRLATSDERLRKSSPSEPRKAAVAAREAKSRQASSRSRPAAGDEEKQRTTVAAKGADDARGSYRFTVPIKQDVTAESDAAGPGASDNDGNADDVPAARPPIRVLLVLNTDPPPASP